MGKLNTCERSDGHKSQRRFKGGLAEIIKKKQEKEATQNFVKLNDFQENHIIL